MSKELTMNHNYTICQGLLRYRGVLKDTKYSHWYWKAKGYTKQRTLDDLQELINNYQAQLFTL